MIGQSPAMLKVFELIKTVAPTDAPVLITGETGSGKELIAKGLHENSSRKNGPMVSINCAALTESLLEAQLFGHKKGSFTGAVKDTTGLLEKADQGTLFLDEIDKMSLALQAKLLRFLEDKTFRPVGANLSISVDVRIIAASNQELNQKIRQGGFLSDLLYRIEVIKIKAPCLKERKEDIPLLCKHFVEHYARHYRKPVQGLNSPCLEALAQYHWPGNVRELKNCLARAVILSRSKTIKTQDLPAKITSSPPKKNRSLPGFNLAEPGRSIKEMEASLIQNTMEHCKGNKSLAARMLGISRKGLYQKLKRLGLNSEETQKP
jgi:DNA-binding NtrC family response regulator